jgi:hypothetical protein
MIGRAGAYGRQHAVAFLALFVALGGTSYAVTQSGLVGSSGQINGCALKGIGYVRLVPQGQTCTRIEQAVSWSQTGPPGAAGTSGAAGQPGAPGQPGAAGPPGPVNVTVRIGAPTTIVGGDAARDGTASVSCHTGEKAVGGGGLAQGPPDGKNDTVMYSSQAIKDGSPVGTDGQTPNGWRVDAHNFSDLPHTLTAEAICAS